jgi:hypothetical protein
MCQFVTVMEIMCGRDNEHEAGLFLSCGWEPAGDAIIVDDDIRRLLFSTRTVSQRAHQTVQVPVPAVQNNNTVSSHQHLRVSLITR